jgi:zinc transport system substrate-binding protein
MTRFARIGFVIAICTVFTMSISNIGCSKAKDPWADVKGGSVKVLVSFTPLYCFTTAVAGDDAKVQTLLDTNGPHGHQVSPSDVQLATGANLFLINGLGLDEFMTKIANASGNKGIKIVEVAEAFPEKKRLRMGDADHDHAKGHEKEKDKAKTKEHDHDYGEWDPHAWLGIEQAILMVEAIRDSLKEADPNHAANYDRRAAEYVEKLKSLQEEGKKLLADKKNRKLIAMHDSLGYFCKSFDLTMVDSIMPRPGVEADLKKLTELAEECKKENIRILAVEPQYNKDKAKTLRDNLKSTNFDIAIVEIDPLETGPHGELGPDYYLKVMRTNLENLAKHMQ